MKRTEGAHVGYSEDDAMFINWLHVAVLIVVQLVTDRLTNRRFICPLCDNILPHNVAFLE